MTIDKYFDEVKSLCHKISKLDSTTVISESRIKRIIAHGWRPKFGSFVTAVQGW